LKDDTDADEPVLILLEIDDPLFSVLLMPEWKQPAQRGPSPLGLVIPVFITTISALTLSTNLTSSTTS